jgi:hypothetical protein
MEIKIEGNKLHIVMDINADPLPLSNKGKGPSRMVASSGGVVATSTIFKNKPLKLGVNAFIDPE